MKKDRIVCIKKYIAEVFLVIDIPTIDFTIEVGEIWFVDHHSHGYHIWKNEKTYKSDASTNRVISINTFNKHFEILSVHRNKKIDSILETT